MSRHIPLKSLIDRLPRMVAGAALLSTLILSILTQPAAAEGDKAINAAIKARNAQMTLYAFNLGILGSMAKGDMAYDAGKASGAASSLAALTRLDAAQMWPEGSDSASVAGSRAKPEMWANMNDVITKAVALQTAATAMEAAAGQGIDALRGAIGGVGGACGACHKAYRGPKN